MANIFPSRGLRPNDPKFGYTHHRDIDLSNEPNYPNINNCLYSTHRPSLPPPYQSPPPYAPSSQPPEFYQPSTQPYPMAPMISQQIPKAGNQMTIFAPNSNDFRDVPRSSYDGDLQFNFGNGTPLNFGSDAPFSLGNPQYGFTGIPDPPNDDVAPTAFSPEMIPPFEDLTLKFGPSPYGVIRIRNIPYSVTKDEILHFLGRHTPVIANQHQGNSIHIIMERSTSKTMDCYVELQEASDAQYFACRHENTIATGLHPKLGTRHIQVDMSSQDELLSDLFSRTRCIIWMNGTPVELANQDPYSTGFKGFFTNEEMVGLVRHAETPQRSPFSQKCLQRTYECMISTLYKFPWFATGHYRLNNREKLFETYMSLLVVLVEKVRAKQTVGLDNKLLMDFLFAGMNCAGFGERKKWTIIKHSDEWGLGFEFSELSRCWPFECLNRRNDADDAIVRYYLHLIELGVQVYLRAHIEQGLDPTLSPFPFPEWIDYQLASDHPPRDPSVIENTKFFYNKEGMKLDMQGAMNVDRYLMEHLLTAGWDRWQEAHGIRGLKIRTDMGQPDRVDWSAKAAKLLEKEADDCEAAEKAEEAAMTGRGLDNDLTPRPYPSKLRQSPPQSPKGTQQHNAFATVMRGPVPSIAGLVGDLFDRPLTRINPSSAPFEPGRLFEPGPAFDLVYPLEPAPLYGPGPAIESSRLYGPGPAVRDLTKSALPQPCVDNNDGASEAEDSGEETYGLGDGLATLNLSSTDDISPPINTNTGAGFAPPESIAMVRAPSFPPRRNAAVKIMRPDGSQMSFENEAPTSSSRRSSTTDPVGTQRRPPSQSPSPSRCRSPSISPARISPSKLGRAHRISKLASFNIISPIHEVSEPDSVGKPGADSVFHPGNASLPSDGEDEVVMGRSRRLAN